LGKREFRVVRKEVAHGVSGQIDRKMGPRQKKIIRKI